MVLWILPIASSFRLQGYYLLRLTFPDHSTNYSQLMEVLNPDAETSVWAVPVSLAATGGIALLSFPPGT